MLASRLPVSLDAENLDETEVERAQATEAEGRAAQPSLDEIERVTSEHLGSRIDGRNAQLARVKAERSLTLGR